MSQNPEQFQSGQLAGGGRFVLKSMLGRGGMGIVWLAEDNRLREQVALKFLHAELASDPEAIDDMRREVLKSRKLTHPNIIRIHDLEEREGEAPFIYMEFVPGSSLHTLRRGQAERLFPWVVLRPIVRQLCMALAYAHEENVIHRDLKPGNMMLDERSRLKLADFGLASSVSGSMSQNSVKHYSAGTPAYMSPQQMRGERPRVTDDIYSLGATLYELLTSRPPFYQGDISTQVHSVPPEPVPERLRSLGRENEIPDHVCKAILGCLAKEPSARPQTVVELAEWMALVEKGAQAGGGVTVQPHASGGANPSEHRTVVEPAPAPPVPGPSFLQRYGVVLGAAALVLAAGVFFFFRQAPPVPKPAVQTPVPVKPTPPLIAPATPPPTVAPLKAATPTPRPATPTPLPATPTPIIKTSPYVPMFTGTSLEGWRTNNTAGLWSAKNGALYADLSRVVPGPTRAADVIQFTGPKSRRDFEFKFSFRLRPPTGASAVVSVRFRVDEGKGYSFDIANEKGLLAELYRLPRGKPISEPNRRAKVMGNRAGDKLQVDQTELNYDAARNAYRPGDWNEVTIVVKSSTFWLTTPNASDPLYPFMSVLVEDFNADAGTINGALELGLSTNAAGAGGSVEFKDLQLHGY